MASHYGILQKPLIQVTLGLAGALLIPVLVALAYFPGNGLDEGVSWSIGGSAAALLLGVYIFRRFDVFPGVKRYSYVLPSFVASYGLVLAGFLFARLDYSRLILGFSFAAAMITFFLICRYSRRTQAHRFYVVPFGNVGWLREHRDFDVQFLSEPVFPAEPNAVLVADLRAEIGDDWERMIAETAISGHAVYHTKQLRESVEGRVQIEHLSENSFGSLLPNLNYRNVKRLIDLLLVVALAPILVVLGPLIALVIKVNSPGPALFRQQRMGYRGKKFTMVKFRTMHMSAAALSGADKREAAKTKAADARIIPYGHFLRRTRLDELPQIWHVLKGQMSFIGPRPEALDLAAWYDERLPFYAYRHIVRPGISGWAQVNQGHVAELDDVRNKLHYDFYYVKNFSLWLDFVIGIRTIATILTGFGSK